MSNWGAVDRGRRNGNLAGRDPSIISFVGCFRKVLKRLTMQRLLGDQDSFIPLGQLSLI